MLHIMHQDGLRTLARQVERIDTSRSVLMLQALEDFGIKLNRHRIGLVATNISRDKTLTTQALRLFPKNLAWCDIHFDLFRHTNSPSVLFRNPTSLACLALPPFGDRCAQGFRIRSSCK